MSGEVGVSIGLADKLRHLGAKEMVNDARARVKIVQPRQQRLNTLPEVAHSKKI